jgi:S-DNA-T family DNA segregation ATPase FtsK/SpoIIIE
VKASRNEISGLALLAVGLVALLLVLPGLLGGNGPAPLRVLFGDGAVIVVLALILGGVTVLFSGRIGWRIPWPAVAAGELLFAVLLTTAHWGLEAPLLVALTGQGGGIFGWATSEFLTAVLPSPLAWAVSLSVLAAIGFLIWLALPASLTSRLMGDADRVSRGLRALLPSDISTRPGLRTSPPAPRGRGEPNAPQDWGERGAAWVAARFAVAKAGLERLRAALDRLRGVDPLPPQDEDYIPMPSPTPLDRSLLPIEAELAVETPPAPAPEEPEPKPKARGRSKRGKAAKGESPVPQPPRPGGLPPMDLLRPGTINRKGQADARQRAQLLKQTLAEFGVPVEVVSIKEGPTVTQFGLEPGEVVKELRGGEVVRRRISVASIQRLSNDLALALAAASLRIEAPVPGRPYVGIEIPNTTKTMVALRSILESPEFAKVSSPLAIALGRDVAGDPIVADLARLPHLLIAGATGSGKSVCINAIVSSLLMNNGAEKVRFLMVDPKMVELPAYNGIPHLFGEVITDASQVTGALAWLALQMDDRYRLFAERGARNIEEYNAKLGRFKAAEALPYIVLVIDELADLMMTAADDVERLICRLAQMSRATGIHLVLATQRPSVDVITGLIKANFPARIAFAVTSQIDSRVILDTPGAEKLLGRGDMLFMAPDSARLARIQGCFVSDQEIDALVAFWKTSRDGDPPNIGAAPWAGMIVASDEGKDELLERALELLQTKRQISASMLQRQLRIGYPRAARLMEQLEEMGAVGPNDGGGRSREVLTRRQESLNGNGADESW